MTHKKTPEEMIRELSEGNPLLDESAYKRALEKCPDEETREVLRTLRSNVLRELERPDGEPEEQLS